MTALGGFGRILLFAVLGTAALVASPVASAAAAVISFDDLAGDAPSPNSTGLPVNAQYASQGVTFTNANAFNFLKETGAIPSFPHSDPVAVEPCAGQEFCQSPMVIRFTAAQQSVKVWIGNDGPSPEGRTVSMNAYTTETGGSPLPNPPSVQIPASNGSTDISLPLEVSLGSPQIRRVEITTPNGYTTGVGVDDVEFSTVGPPPPCGATSVPTVILTQPENGLQVQQDKFLLQGTVDGGGAPITGATIRVSSESPRVGSMFPGLIDEDGGTFGPIYGGGLLSPGKNDIVVQATNCKGTGTSSPSPVLYEPIASTAAFRQLGEIEVTQTVQNPDNGVPLIAASNGGVKRTFARVYLGLEGAASAIRRVSGRLTATRPTARCPAARRRSRR